MDKAGHVALRDHIVTVHIESHKHVSNVMLINPGFKIEAQPGLQTSGVRDDKAEMGLYEARNLMRPAAIMAAKNSKKCSRPSRVMSREAMARNEFLAFEIYEEPFRKCVPCTSMESKGPSSKHAVMDHILQLWWLLAALATCDCFLR